MGTVHHGHKDPPGGVCPLHSESVLSTDQNLQVIFSLQTTVSTKTPPVFQQRMIGHINLTTDTEAPSTGRSEPAPGGSVVKRVTQPHHACTGPTGLKQESAT